MKEYFKLEGSIYIDYGLTRAPDLNDQSVFLGKIINADLLPELQFEVNFPDDSNLPHFLTGGSVLVSGLFIDSLAAAGITNFQAFSAKVINPSTKKERDGYFLFNVLGLLRAADINSSDYDVIMDGDAEGVNLPLLAFREVVIDASKVKNISLFRLAEGPGELIIDQKVVDVLKKYRPADGWGIDLVRLEVK